MTAQTIVKLVVDNNQPIVILDKKEKLICIYSDKEELKNSYIFDMNLEVTSAWHFSDDTALVYMLKISRKKYEKLFLNYLRRINNE